MFFQKKKIVTVAVVAAFIMTLFSGCGSDQTQQAQVQKKQVKAMKVIQRDTPLTIEFAGNLVGKDEVKVQSKVSGNVVEKFVKGGQFVQEGQPLYRIDSRQYETAILQAQANLAQSEAQLHNAQIDLQRDQKLLESEAIAEQVVTTQAATVRAYEAAAAANEASVRLAIENLQDTMIYAPMSGQLSVDDVAVGTFASAGNTTLVTIGSSNPIYAQFSISEADYLKFMTVQSMKSDQNPIDVTITLADGKEYPFVGRIVETDRSLANNTGSLTMKALFPNPSGLLMPGMFARVKLSGETIPNAILVPQRAVQQLLGKSFVMVVNKENKSEARTVELGDKIGSYYIVNSGLTTDDMVVVEGLTNLREGVELQVQEVTSGEMGFTLVDVVSTYDADAGLTKKNTNPNAPANIQQSNEAGNNSQPTT